MFNVLGMAFRSGGAAALLSFTLAAYGAELSPATLKAWDEYISAAETCASHRLAAGNTFLWIDESPERAARVRKGDIVVSPASAHTPQRVPSGMIHDWIAGAFIPDTGIDRLIASLRQYDDYSEIYHPAVVKSAQLSESDREDRFSLLLISKGIGKTAVDGEFSSSFTRSGSRAWRVARATRLREIDNYGQRGERMLPEDQGAGYVWRFYSVSRMEERDGGVYLETELIALSRDIPASIEWLVAPMIRRVARNALSAMLEDTRNAVLNPPVRAAEAAPHGSFKPDVK
ncbi:MAG TPA: hypothetical protein VKX39_00695 [Bryobacteraceae bacterium]|jgi:hypothetical protein|nr:hypothetical protein [Bryobacteraceae bacterium]